MEPDTIPERTRIEHVPFGWEGQGGLLWQMDVDAADHVLGDDSGTVLARWTTINNKNSQQDAIGGAGSRGGKALRPPGGPLLTILAAPSGTEVNDSMWVEFVVASGVCVLNRERVVGGDALDTMF